MSESRHRDRAVVLIWLVIICSVISSAFLGGIYALYWCSPAAELRPVFSPKNIAVLYSCKKNEVSLSGDKSRVVCLSQMAWKGHRACWRKFNRFVKGACLNLKHLVPVSEASSEGCTGSFENQPGLFFLGHYFNIGLSEYVKSGRFTVVDDAEWNNKWVIGADGDGQRFRFRGLDLHPSPLILSHLPLNSLSALLCRIDLFLLICRGSAGDEQLATSKRDLAFDLISRRLHFLQLPIYREPLQDANACGYGSEQHQSSGQPYHPPISPFGLVVIGLHIAVAYILCIWGVRLVCNNWNIFGMCGFSLLFASAVVIIVHGLRLAAAK